MSSVENRCEVKSTGGYGSTGGAIYGLAFLGALVYYIQTAETFWMGVLGFLKALVWPAFLVHRLMQFLNM